MGRHRSLSLAQQAEVWRRWKEGQTLSDIARALGRWEMNIHTVVDPCGGIAPESDVARDWR